MSSMNPSMNLNPKDTVGTVDGFIQCREPAVRFVSSGEYFDYILKNSIHKGFTIEDRILTGLDTFFCPEIRERLLKGAHTRLCYEAGIVLDLETKYLLRTLAKILRMELAFLKKEEELS